MDPPEINHSFGYNGTVPRRRRVHRESAMSDLIRHLAHYAAYHRDRRNIATHFAGIPLILIAALLGLTLLPIPGTPVNCADLAIALSALYYLRLDLRLGAIMLLILGGGRELALVLAGWPSPLTLAVILFAAGWTLQFIGHYLEGKKPAFFDDLASLLIGPLFLVAETGFALGWRAGLKQDVRQAARHPG
ncbi:Mpo1 family 2-hydroxy fatty acid dioxygenase [Paludibacterium paludis]|nr:Mpo1-like protein [Paludibacterium paludis]